MLPLDQMIGQVIDGRYRILRKLGDGGMAEVFLVEHAHLGTKEALKVLHQRLSDHPQFVSRFRREARATNRLHHPNIVTTYDFGRLPDGRFYLAMEYVDGQDLFQVIHREGALDVTRALSLMVQLADAIDHAHAMGVVHRDLKPENVVLIEHRGHSDVLKVLDFGVAKIIAPGYKETQGITRDGEVFGTVQYMAPEQLSGRGAADPRIDIYAAGCLFFEMLVGRPPFDGRIMEVAHMHMSKIPDYPSQLRPGANISSELDSVVRRCLAKDPSVRYQRGSELRAAIMQLPGYGPLRRRSSRKISATELFDAATAEDIAVGPAPDRAAGEDLDERLKLALRDAAESLLDFGRGDVELIITMADVKELEGELEQLSASITELEDHTSAVEQAGRRRESSLRFALGELIFEASQSKLGRPDVQQQIEQLRTRLKTIANELEQELTRLTDRAISLAASRAVTEDNLRATYRKLDELVESRLENFSDQPTVKAAKAKLFEARGPRPPDPSPT